jgi:2,4-dienoyl-CoA reductase-like NADH-dependent reductase (Old Yellow Enzyme family)
MLFETGNIGTLQLPNRLIRSATAELMVNPDGSPSRQLESLYRELARGGVGLIITGHMYVHPSGKAHPGMLGVHADNAIPALASLADAAHREGGRIAVQINHGGMQCSAASVSETIAPSVTDFSFLKRPAREMTPQEIDVLIDAFAQAARRVKEAGCDGVQIHSAHGYLISQFLSPFVNKRTDEWGAGPEGQMRFLRAVCAAVREQVGPEYPTFIKLGMVDAVEGGLTVEGAADIVAELVGMGLDGLEISGGIGGGGDLNVRPGIRTEADEGYFRHLAQAARLVTQLPIALVGGFRSLSVMEEVLVSGDADFISLCRPLISEPDLSNQLKDGSQQKAACISGNRCWPEDSEEGIACKCEGVRAG